MIEISAVDELIPRGLIDGLTEGAVNEILYGIAEAARSEWIRLAGKEFFSTRRDYIAGIQPVSLRPGVATIRLVGQLPNLLEEGIDKEIDMHDTLLGPRVPLVPLGQRGKHPSKDGGEYRAIPFRHAGPTAGGAVGQPMGRPYTGHQLVPDARKMGKAVYAQARQLEASVSKPGGPTRYGGRLESEMAYSVGRGKSKKELTIPKLRDYHAVDIYAGMVRMEKKYREATQSTYMTFRTIAKDAEGKPVGSSPWKRRATKGRGLAKQVNEFVAEIAPKAFQAYVEGLK